MSGPHRGTCHGSRHVPEHDEAPPGLAGRGFVTRSAALTRCHLTTTARMSRAERMRYSSPEYLTSVPPYLL